MKRPLDNKFIQSLDHAFQKISDEYRRASIVKLFLIIRLIFILAGFVLLTILSIQDGHSVFSFNKENLPRLWFSWIVLTGWSGVILIVITTAVLQPKYSSLMSWIIGLSLFCDSYAIYWAATVTGGKDSSIYHSVYLLIAFHSYYFPTYVSRLRKPWRYFRYLAGGGLMSTLSATTIYCLLAKVSPRSLDVFLEFGLQMVTAITWTLLRRNDERSFRYVRKTNLELERTRKAQETLTKSLQDVTAIAKVQNRKALRKNLFSICETIGQNLNAEFCSIGFCENKRVERMAYWMAFEKTHKIERTLNKYLRNRKLKNTLLESVLFKYRKPFNWDANVQGDLLDPNNNSFQKLGLNIKYSVARDTKQNILTTQKINHILILPLYSQTRSRQPVGYIQVLNRLTPEKKLHEQGFSDSQVEIMEMVGSQLAVAFENFQIHQVELSSRREEKFLNSLVRLNDLDEIILRSLKYLNSLTNSRVASFWVPTQDGLGTPEQITKVALRALHVGCGDTQPEADERLQATLQEHSIFGLDACYIGRLLKTPNYDMQIRFEADLSKVRTSWDRFQSKIGSRHLIAIPIRRYGHSGSGPPKDKIWRGILGFACLRPQAKHFEFSDALKHQLESFASHLGIVIEQARYKRRYDQIVLLKNRLEKLPRISELEQFTQTLVGIVKDVLDAEACSLFMLDSRSEALVLKASTAQRFHRQLSAKKTVVVDTGQYLEKAIYRLRERSITGEIFKRGETALMYNVLKNEYVNRSFMEETASGPHVSLIGSPIVKSDGTKIGVIRCINKNKERHLLPIFLHGDKEQMELIVGIITGFIENAIADAEKQEYLRQLAHEFSSPLHALEAQINYVETIFKGRQHVKDPDEQFQYLREETAYLSYLIQDIQLTFGRGANLRSSYSFDQKVDLRPVIDKVRKLLVSDARYDKEIDIYGYTSEMPLLYVDKMRLEQVFFNLLQNAVKYSRERAHDIIIQYDPVEQEFPDCPTTQWHAISFKNWGIGVLEDELELIFQEYKRGTNAMEVAVSGTGIGLAVSREIVENHDGFLKVTRLTMPTIFTVYLPGYLSERKPSS